jgi:hypothetical protein
LTLKDAARLATFDAEETKRAEDLAPRPITFGSKYVGLFGRGGGLLGSKLGEKEHLTEEVETIKSIIAHSGNFFP